jgi:hypothetical protein
MPSLKESKNYDEESADQVDPLPVKAKKGKSQSSGSNMNSYEEEDFDSSGSQ